jgi:molecular chaperone DnaK
MATDNRTLGRFQLTDIPPSQRGIPQIEVTFDIDANGIIDVKALDKGTGKQQNIKIESGSSLSEEEINRMKKEAEANADEDNKKKEEVEKINQADSMVFQTEKQLKEYEDKIDEKNKEDLTNSIDKLKKALEEKDLELIDNLMEDINTKWQEISSQLYQQTEESTKTENSDATDVEFEEVK